MNNKLIGIEQFFDCNFRIKKTMLNICDYKYYDPVTYSEVISKNLNNIKIMFNSMINGLSFNDQFIVQINNFIDMIIEKFNDVPVDSKALNNFNEEYVSQMSVDLENYLGENFCGYRVDYDYGDAINKCHSLNDLLHSIHHIAINDESIFDNIPVLGEKDIISKSTGEKFGTIRLIGKENTQATEIFDSITNDYDELNLGYTDILSLDNRILIMIRDIGHALSIDIDTSDNDKASIKFFIPKLWSEQDVKLLKNTMKDNGIDNLSVRCYEYKFNSTYFAMGGFDVAKSDLANQLTRCHGFIDMIPTDFDLPLSTEFHSNNDLNLMLEDNSVKCSADTTNTNICK